MPFDHRQWEELQAGFSSGRLDPDGLSSDFLRRAQTDIVERLRGSTLVRRYMDHLGRADNRNTEPWHAEGERLYAALLVALAGAEPTITIGYNMDSFGPEDTLKQAVGTAMALLMAQPYLWTDEIEDLAGATPLPRHVISAETLPYPFMFWSRETAHGTDDHETNWLLVLRAETCIRVIIDTTELSTRRMHILIGDIAHGAVYPDDVPTDSTSSVAPVLARIAFLNSPYVDTARARIPRALRRLGVREGVLPPSPSTDGTINVVTLRREARAAVAAHDQAEAEGRAYRHQWWVSGHIRSQWYPSEQAHHLKWIAPYLKGPPDAPVLPKVYAVSR